MSSYVALIANPKAGTASRKRMELASKVLRERGRDVEVLYTRGRGDGVRLAREAAAKSPSVVIAAGGDGTFNEVANGLANTDVPMALLPSGTSNVLAKEFGIPEDVRGAVDRIVAGTARSVFLGKIRWEEGKERLFCLMVGIGFDAEAVYRTRGSALMKISGKAAHVIKGFGVLAGWSAPALRVTADGKAYDASSLIVCNASKYAGHMMVVPDASMLEPGLYMFLMHGRKKFDVLRYAFGVLRGTNIKFGDVTYREVSEVRVDGKARIQADGDYLGKTPAIITAGAARLRLIT